MSSSSFALLDSLTGNDSFQDCRQLALDVDSTVYDLIGAMNAVDGSPDLNVHALMHWDHLLELCGDTQNMIRLFDEAMHFEAMKKVEPFEGVREALQEYAERRIDVHVMTMRPSRYLDDVRRWFAYFDLPVKSVRCDMPMDKAQLCVDNNIGVIVDDSPETLLAAHNKGIRALTLDYPYNRSVVEQLGLVAAPQWNLLSGLSLGVIEELLQQKAEQTA